MAEELTILARIKSMFDGSGFNQATKGVSGLKTAMAGLGLTVIGSQFAAFTKSAVSAAMTAEQEWNRFGTAVNNSGGNWDAQGKEIKDWVTSYSNDMGRAVSDTRAAMTTFMNMGMSFSDSQNAMKATSNMAAQLGMSQEEAAGQLQKAFMGNGRAIKQLGLDIKNYKDSTTGAIDKQRLMNDILKRTEGSADKYANSTAGKLQRMQNQWAALKTEFGGFVADALSPFIPVAQAFVSALNKMPGPLKSVLFGIVALGGGFTMIAGPAMTAIGALQGVGKALGLLNSGGGSAGGGGAGQAGKGIPNTGNAGGKGIVATLQGLKGFGRALLGLVPDIIMATAAIAVVIACIFALAAEVIILAKGIQMLIDAMKFGDIDLNDDIEGLKKLGDAMIQIVIILGAMTLANIGAITSTVTGGVLALAVGLKTIKDSYKKVADAVNELKNMGDIDQAGLDKLKKLGESMKAIGDVAQGLNNVNQGMNLGSAINGFVAWFTGGEADIGTNISNLITKTREIAPKFSELSTLPDIDQSGVDKIQKVGDAMQHLGQVASGLQGVQGGFVGAFMDWWQGDTAAQVDKAIEAVKTVGMKLQGLGAINIPDMGWIDRVAVGLSSLKNAGTQLNGFAGLTISPDVATNVGNAVTAVKNIATQLSGLSGENIGDVSSILSQIQTAIQTMKDTLNNANFNAEGVNIGTSLTTGVQQGLGGLSGVVGEACNQATSTAQSQLPPGFASAASNATNSFRDNLKLGDIANAEMDYAIQAVNSKSGALAQAAANAANEAVQAAKNAAGQKSPGYIAQSWGREFGEYSPMKIKEGASKLISAVKSVTGLAVNAWNGALPFSSTNTVGALSTGLNTAYTSANTPNTGSKIINVGEGAFIIQVSEMTAQECRGIVMEALDTI